MVPGSQDLERLRDHEGNESRDKRDVSESRILLLCACQTRYRCRLFHTPCRQQPHCSPSPRSKPPNPNPTLLFLLTKPFLPFLGTNASPARPPVTRYHVTHHQTDSRNTGPPLLCSSSSILRPPTRRISFCPKETDFCKS